ncbi:MAG: hypothetical protein DME65_05055 [Verrucomicrobia bacterium]|nr:MAG: hypothetical protein DME65_05055 [Verrucomicrobiota bacterium]
MVIEDQKAAKIQELLKQLSTADNFQSVAITREIRDVATEVSQQEQITTGKPVAIKPPGGI